MRVMIKDDDENWLKWGRMVEDWINNPAKRRPVNVGELKAALVAAGVTADVDGANGRPVEITDYSNNAALNHPLVINLPSAQMLADRKKMMAPAGEYELPKFYDLAYVKGVRAVLSPQLKDEFRLRRIGEYSVNECC